MNMNVSKTNGVKLLAAVMVMAMVFAGAAVVLSDSEVNAAPTNTEGMINLNDHKKGDGYSFESGTLTLNGYKGTQGFYYDAALNIIVAGENSITVTTNANADEKKAFAAIYTTSGAITIKDDDVATTTDKLTITVNGATTGSGGSEWTYGIYSHTGLTISDIAVDINVATSDRYAFAIEGNGNTSFTNVTGSIDGGNRAIQMGKATLTFSGCDLTLTGSEKAIQSKTTGGSIVIEDESVINAKINSSYAGSNTGEDDGFAIKAVKISVDNTSTLNTDGLRVVYTASGDTAKLDGTVTINDYTYGNAAKPDIGFTVDENATVTVGDEKNAAKLTINSEATFNGNVTVSAKAVAEINNIVENKAAFANNGTLLMGNAGSIDGIQPTGNGTVASTITQTGTSTGLQNYIDSDFTIPSGGAFLTQNLTIKSGATLTVPARAELNLNGYSLIVEGTLAVERNGVVAALGTQAGETAEGILLGATGAIENNGIIGTESHAVTIGVANGGTGTVEMLNVAGVSFNLIRDGTPGAYTYYLGVSGDVGKASGTNSNDTKVFEITGAIVNGDLSVSRDITLSGTFTVAKNGSVTTNGDLAAAVTLQNGASITVNGKFSSATGITAQTAEDIPASQIDSYAFNGTNTVVTTTGTNYDASGFTISVSRTQYTENNNVYFNQRAYITGSITAVKVNESADTSDAKLNINGNMFIASDVTVSLTNVTVTTTATTGLIIVDGTMSNVGEADFSYVGAYYTVTTEGTTSTVTGYITTFDAAMGAIADADDTTITVSGDANFPIEVTGTYTIEADQIVTGTAPAIVIAESGRITVNDGGALDAVIISSIDGMLIVMDGGDCEPASDLYDVTSTNENGDVTYAGLQVVLSGAQAGDEITVTGPNATASTITVPNGVTLNIEGTLTVERSVTVAEGGVLNVTGTLNIGKAQAGTVRAIPGTLTVNGTADITEGTLTMVGGTADAKTTVTSTGSLIYSARNNLVNGNTAAVNGAYYSGTDGFVLTTVSKAVAGAIEAETMTVTVIGTVSDTTDVVLGGVTLTVEGTVTLGNVDVQSSNVISKDGTLTATLVGQS